jgi:GTP-binding protein
MLLTHLRALAPLLRGAAVPPPAAAAAALRLGAAAARALAAAAESPPPDRIRNVAVIAHVDHGKTTLMDRLLAAGEGGAGAVAGAPGSGASGSANDRGMDSLDLERERGITILSKMTSLSWRGRTLNVVDTPGHADFGGEVERVLGVVDGAVLLVDASEGPLSQTRFVLGKALARGLRPVVVLNKVDRPAATAARCGEAESAIFDAFAALGATDEQLDFPVLYASAREGWAAAALPETDAAKAAARAAGMAPLLDALLERVPPPEGDPAAPFSMLAVWTEADPYLGRIVSGRVASGSVAVGDRVRVLPHAGGAPVDGFRVTRLLKRRGLGAPVEIARAGAGDVVSLAGAAAAGVADTVAAPSVTAALPPGRVDPPTLAMVFAPNSSPLAGREGKQLTGPKIGARLAAEAETSVSLRVARAPAGGAAGGEAFEVQARGELQLGLLIESMRREGFELSVSPPRVLERRGASGELLEPVEEVVCEVDDAHAGEVIEALTRRKGELLEAAPAPDAEGRQRLVFEAPARGLIGFRPLFAAATRGSGILHRAFARWGPHRGALDRVRRGALVSTARGKVTAHALALLESRGTLFVAPGEEVYEGMVIGESARGGDLEVNPVREKKLTNVSTGCGGEW